MKRTTFCRVLLILSLPLMSSCVTVSGGGGTRALGGPQRWLDFGPLQTFAGGRAFRIDSSSDTDLATDRRGHWLWVASIPTAPQGGRALYLSRSDDNGGSWSEPVAIAPGSTDNSAPRLFAGERKMWGLVWTARQGSVPVTMFARSLDEGRTWSPAVRLNNAFDDEEFSPVVTGDAFGTWLCAWVGHERQKGETELQYSWIVTSLSTDHGATWSAPTRLYRSTLPGKVRLFDPVSAQDDVRTFTLAFSEHYSPSGAVRGDRILALSTRDKGRTWYPARVVAESYGMRLRLAYGSNQACTAVWESGRWTGDNVWEPVGIACSRSENLGEAWSQPALIAAPATPGMALGNPRLATDNQGNWMAVWQAWSPAEQDEDVWAAVSRDNGRSWNTPAPVYSEDPADRAPDRFSLVGSDGRGRWIVQWERLTGNGDAAPCYRINDLPKAWWRNVEVGVGVSGSIPL